jgi:hypothetical protein
MPLAAWCWYTLVLKDQVHKAQRYQKKETKVKNPNSLGWLSGAYFCEGFGYIVIRQFTNDADWEMGATLALHLAQNHFKTRWLLGCS